MKTEDTQIAETKQAPKKRRKFAMIRIYPKTHNEIRRVARKTGKLIDTVSNELIMLGISYYFKESDN